jgi:hypothetical protein
MQTKQKQLTLVYLDSSNPKQRINTLLEESFALLENFDNRADGLRYLSKMIVERDM